MCDTPQKISIILPTYNERDSITSLINTLCDVLDGWDYEIIVVDDNSPDGTSLILHDLGIHIKQLRCLVRTSDRGLIPSIREGIKASCGNICIWMDADGSMPPTLVPQMVQMIYDGADLVLGSRYITGGGIKGSNSNIGKTSIWQLWKRIAKSEDSFLSIVLSKYGNILLRLVLRRTIHDYSSGFFCGRKSIIEKIGVGGYFVDYCVSLPYLAIMQGYIVREIPMILQTRKYGQSKTSSSIGNIIKIAWQCFYKAIMLRVTVPDERGGSQL